MSSQLERETQNRKIASLWGSSWQKLSPRQRQLVGDIMQNVNIVNVAEHLEEKVYRMPAPDFIECSEYSQPACLCDRASNTLLTISWQSVLTKTAAALVNQSYRELIKVLFLELDYQQITKNAIIDLCALVKKPADLTTIAAIELQIERLKELFPRYFPQPASLPVETVVETLDRDDLEATLNTLITQTKELGVTGLGAFTLAVNLHLSLLQEKAMSEPKEIQNLRRHLKSYIAHTKSVTPQIFRLTVGKIDKTCKCIKYNPSLTEKLPEYECRYSDSKNIHIFRDRSERVGYECNKHRLTMFHSTVERVMQTAVNPLRSAIKNWEQLAECIAPMPI